MFTRRLILLTILFGFFTQTLAQSRIEILEQNYKAALQKKDNTSSMRFALQAGDFYLADKKYDKATIWYNNAIKSASAVKDNSGKCAAFEGIGNIYSNQNLFNKAIDAYEKSISFAREIQDKRCEANSLYNLAQAEESLNHYKRAIKPLEQALVLALELSDNILLINCYSALYNTNERLGNKDEAVKYKKLFEQLENSKEITTSLQQKIVKSQLENEIVRKENYQVKSNLLEKEVLLKKTADSLQEVELLNHQRQLQIDLLQKSNELAQLKVKEREAEIENDKLWRNSLLVGLLLVITLATVLIIGFKSRLDAKKKIERQNQNIKSSITYAKRIQEAMLPNSETLSNIVPESFVLFKPRDTVSGDFYWFTEIQNENGKSDLAFAAVDCTGHGVPGAFMSMIGMNSLNGIVSRGILQPDQILSRLHEEIRSSLRQPETGNNDGMDITLCIYKQDNKKIEFAGAKNPMVYIRNNELHQIKGDIHPIGGSKSKPTIAYKKHEVCVEEPTMVYLFSDGYRDQFGGPDNAKFMSKKFNQLLLDIHQWPMNLQKDKLEKTIEAWKGKHPQTDDILVLGIRLGG